MYLCNVIIKNMVFFLEELKKLYEQRNKAE